MAAAMQAPFEHAMSLSQSTAPPTNIFTLSAQPIRVFVEASGVQSRPKLIRSLRNAGAHISLSPNDAQVILVDSSTLEGVQFVREWTADSGKVVLEAIWARKCMKAGRLLWDADNWGGCLCALSSDGQSVVIATPQEEPNPTPTRPVPGPSARPAAPPAPAAESRPLSSSGTAHSNGAAAVAQSSRRSSSVQLNHVPSPGPSSYPPPPPPSQGTPQLPYPQLQTPAQLLALQQQMQQIPPNILPELLNMYALQRMTYPGLPMMPYNPMFYPSQPDQAQNIPYNPLQPHPSQPLPQPQQQQQQPYSPLRMSNMSPPPPVARPPSARPPYSSSSQTSRDAQSPFSRPVSSSHKRKTPPSLSPSSYSPSPSPSASAASVSTPMRSKGKEPADSHRDATPDLSQPSQTASSSRGSPPRRTILSHRRPGEIFISDAGEPLLFHVQVDLKNRMQVLQAIKKNGGKITPDIENADYIILYTRSKTFNALYDSTEANGKVPVQPTFVLDCVEENALLDPENYILEHPDPKRRRKKAKNKTKANGKGTPAKSKAASAKRTRRTRIVPVSGDDDGGGVGDSPPPPTNTILLPTGKYLFTDEEREYARDYIELCLTRDPTTSGTRIAQKLAAKMPNHTPSSWSTVVGRMNAWTDSVRKRVSASRMQPQSAADAPTPDGVSHGTGGGGGEVSQAGGSADDIYHQELNYLVHFLMTNDPNESEEQTFQRLENQAPCRTSASWIQFYDEHVEDITRALGFDAGGVAPESGHMNPEPKVEET